VNGANLADGEAFSIADGSHVFVTFEFDLNSNGVTFGNVAVPAVAGDSAATVKTKIINAVNGAASLDVTAANGGSGLVNLVNDIVGVVGNQAMSEGVADTGFTVVGMSGGADPSNASPVLAAIGNRAVNEGQQLQFTLSGSDADDASLTYSASNLPAGASFDPATRTFTWTPGFTQAGSYPNVHFQVTDGAATDSEDISIAVQNVNRAPILDPMADTTVSEGQALQFSITATDPDGDPLTYLAANLPSGASFDPATRTFSWTPASTQAGSYPNVYFQVFDGAAIDFQRIAIAVNDVPDASRDTAAPETAIDSGPKKVKKPKASFAFSSSEPGSTFECQLDKQPFGPCSSPKKLKHLKAGEHTFSVRAIDPAQNPDPTPATARFKVKLAD
jgi:putative Ig domain-containing protein